MAHGQGATSNARGGYGAFGRGTRGHGKKPRTVKQAEARERDPRLRKAFEETDQARADLEALIEEQKTNPAIGPTEGATYVLKRREAEAALAEKERLEREAETRAALEDAIADERVLPPEKFDKKKLPREGNGSFRFALTTARIMLKEGYNAKYVCEFTGVGLSDLEDIELDRDGYGITLPEDEGKAEKDRDDLQGVKCEGLMPSNCGNPSCPAHGVPQV